MKAMAASMVVFSGAILLSVATVTEGFGRIRPDYGYLAGFAALILGGVGFAMNAMKPSEGPERKGDGSDS